MVRTCFWSNDFAPTDFRSKRSVGQVCGSVVRINLVFIRNPLSAQAALVFRHGRGIPGDRLFGRIRHVRRLGLGLGAAILTCSRGLGRIPLARSLADAICRLAFAHPGFDVRPFVTLRMTWICGCSSEGNVGKKPICVWPGVVCGDLFVLVSRRGWEKT